MTKSALLSTSFATIAIPLLLAAPAEALNSRSWVSGLGTDSAPCTRSAPCATLQHAHDQTVAGGEISILDSGDFGIGAVFFISKSISIVSEGAEGGYQGNGIIINGGATDFINLRGLIIDGFIVNGQGGIIFNSGAALNIENCVIRNFTANSPGIGILFQPNGAAKLVVSDTSLSGNGQGLVGGGIVVKPPAGGSALVTLNRVTAAKNVFGIAADGTGSTAGINMTIADSVISGNSQDGIIATTPSGGAPIGVMVTNTKSVNNAAFGIRSIGPNVTVRVGDSTITGNNIGLSFSGGGALLTYGTNKVQANGSDGAFFGAVGLQ